ncbi:MAG TPA: phosphodiester glycosidase family protein [Pyrinomonadaceae bacterium]|nr:phosphodiester glycosidase family protein [Pyrinomonadaceae bacterium]
MTTTKYFSNFTSAKLVFFLCVLCALCVRTNAQDFKQVHPGVEYAQVETKLGGDPVKINLLRLDLKKVRLDVHHALDKAIGMETTSSIAKRHNGVAAINAGFFRLDKSEFAGDASGVLVINGTLLSESSNSRIAIGIHNGKKFSDVDFAHLNSVLNLKVNKDSKVGMITGINRSRSTNDIVIYTPDFGSSTLTSDEGLEITVEGGRATEVRNKKGNSAIPSNGFVISASGQLVEKVSSFEVGDKTSLVTGVTSAEGGVTRAKGIIQDITNGVPQLIKNGKIDITWEQEKASKSFAETRHPRTAVAKLKDGKFLMMTVDGRQPGVSVGMSLQELAEYLFSLGAIDAMNLDGGGSTTMFLDGKVVNTPSDKEGERKIGDAIVVTLRKKR